MNTTEIGIAPAGFRLPASTRIGRVRLQVSSLETSVAYYERVLGLRVIERAGGRVTLGAAADDSVILELVELRGARPVPRRGLLGLYHFAVLLPDRASLAKFVVHLADIGEYAGMSDHLVSEAVYLTDPDGLGIEVYSDRPRDTWKAVDREVSMTTKPLDVQDLVQAANGEKWTGAPAGTKIGHVHFYVGDIDQAARFYHDGLGMDKIVWQYPGALFLSAGGYHHHVGTNIWARGAPPASSSDAKILDWEVVVPEASSVEEVARSLEAAGFAASRENGETSAADPWGIRVRIHAE